MKKKFKEFYSLIKKNDIFNIQNLTLIFDTNVLLAFYRFDEKMQSMFFKHIKDKKLKIFLPFNVGLEYQLSRDLIIKNKDFTKNKLDQLHDDVKNKFEYLINDFQNNDDRNLDGLISKLDTAKYQVSSVIDQLIKDSFDDYTKSDDNDYFLDSIRDKIDSIIDSIGNEYSSEDINKIYAEGEERYANKIPPGFKDENKKNDSFCHGGIKYLKKYGDLIIWKQILDYISKSEVNSTVLFITNDLKSDYWKVINESKIPHPYLKKEAMLINKNVKFDMITAKDFFKLLVTDTTPSNQKVEYSEKINSILNRLEINSVDKENNVVKELQNDEKEIDDEKTPKNLLEVISSLNKYFSDNKNIQLAIQVNNRINELFNKNQNLNDFLKQMNTLNKLVNQNNHHDILPSYSKLDIITKNDNSKFVDDTNTNNDD